MKVNYTHQHEPSLDLQTWTEERYSKTEWRKNSWGEGWKRDVENKWMSSKIWEEVEKNAFLIFQYFTCWVQLDLIFVWFDVIIDFKKDHFSLFIIKVSDLRIDEIKHFWIELNWIEAITNYQLLIAQGIFSFLFECFQAGISSGQEVIIGSNSSGPLLTLLGPGPGR